MGEWCQLLDHEKRGHVLINSSNPRGFSLVELMIGIAITALLLGLAVPSFQAWLNNAQIRTAAESVLNGLQRARAESVSRNANVEFVLGAGSSWEVKLAGAGGATIESRSSKDGSPNVVLTVSPVAVPVLTTVTFNGLGGLGDNADGSDRFSQVDFDSSVLDASVSKNLRVTIGVGGNARMCDPNAAVASASAC